MDQHEHSTSLDQMGLDESTVMAFHLDPGCMCNLLAIVNVPKHLETCNKVHVNKVCFIARLVGRLSTEYCTHLKLQVQVGIY